MAKYQFRRFIRVLCGGIDVSALRISFDISNSADDTPPEGKIDIYNLSRRHHAQIEERGVDAVVDAGYTGGAGVYRLFTGTVKYVVKTRVDHAFVTRIFLENAILSDSNRVVNISEDDNSLLVRDIAKKLVVNEMGMRVNNLEAIPANAVYPNFVASGDPKKALGTLLAGTPAVNGDPIKAVVDEESISFMAGLAPIRQHETIVKTPKNGLVGVPETQEEDRANFRMLLEPRLKAGGAFEVRDSQYIPDATYTITKVQHIGDNWTGKFISQIECSKEGSERGSGRRGSKTGDQRATPGQRASGFGEATFADREGQATTPGNLRDEN